MSDCSAVSRRRLLELLGASSIGGIAGCGGQSGTPESTAPGMNTSTESPSPTHSSTTAGTETPTETASGSSFDLRAVQYPKTISEGAKIEVRFEILNEGERRDRTEVFVELHDIELSRQIELAPGGSETVIFTFEVTTPPGNYELVVYEHRTGETFRDQVHVEKRVLDLPWIQLPGPSGGPVYTISISAADPDAIYSGTRTAGTYATSDGGSSWIQGLSGQHHRAKIWASPHDPGTAYKKNERTDNGGKYWYGGDWSDKDRHGPIGGQADDNTYVYDMAWDPFDENIIYAGADEGFYRTEDDGRNWSRIQPDVEVAGEGRPVAVNSAREGVLAAGFVGGNDKVTIVRSTDRGDTWSILTEFPDVTQDIRGLIYGDPSVEELFFAINGRGVYRLIDGDITEITADLPQLSFAPAFRFALSADTQRLYFIGGPAEQTYPTSSWWDDRRLYVYDSSTDKVSTVNPPEKPSAVAAHPGDPITIYVGGRN